MLRDVHGQFAMRVNRMRELSGHLWQGRYFSSPLDANYLVNAVRYVELNPVRAGLVATAELYMWSSAATRCGLKSDPVLAAVPTVAHWRALRTGHDGWRRACRTTRSTSCVGMAPRTCPAARRSSSCNSSRWRAADWTIEPGANGRRFQTRPAG